MDIQEDKVVATSKLAFVRLLAAFHLFIFVPMFFISGYKGDMNACIVSFIISLILLPLLKAHSSISIDKDKIHFRRVLIFPFSKEIATSEFSAVACRGGRHYHSINGSGGHQKYGLSFLAANHREPNLDLSLWNYWSWNLIDSRSTQARQNAELAADIMKKISAVTGLPINTKGIEDWLLHTDLV